MDCMYRDAPQGQSLAWVIADRLRENKLVDEQAGIFVSESDFPSTSLAFHTRRMLFSVVSRLIFAVGGKVGNAGKARGWVG